MYVVVVKPNYGLLHGIDALMSNFYKPHKGFISFISIATKEIIGISRRKKWIIPSLFMECQFLAKVMTANFVFTVFLSGFKGNNGSLCLN